MTPDSSFSFTHSDSPTTTQALLAFKNALRQMTANLLTETPFPATIIRPYLDLKQPLPLPPLSFTPT